MHFCLIRNCKWLLSGQTQLNGQIELFTILGCFPRIIPVQLYLILLANFFSQTQFDSCQTFYLDSPKEISKYSISFLHMTKGMPDLADPVEHNKHTDVTRTDTRARTGATNKLHRQMSQSPARLCSLHSPVWAQWCITVNSTQSGNMKIWIINVATIFWNYATPFFQLCG